MKAPATIGIIHNSYQLRGGEDSVVRNEVKLLADRDLSVRELRVTNDSISSGLDKLRVALDVSYSVSSKNRVSEYLARSGVDLVHIHNLFPILTPSIYDACAENGTPVVHTLHNYRTICPGALLTRDGKICEKCVTGSPYQSVLHRCYRDSTIGTLSVARMVSRHRKRDTWNKRVNRFIALGEVAKAKFIEGGFESERIAVKPHFIYDPVLPKTDLSRRKRTVLFVGRISREKGLRTLTEAWKGLAADLLIAGEGPLLAQLSNSNRSSNIKFLGVQSKTMVSDLMLEAQFLVMPSECYEGFPLVLVEAFAHGLPVLASRLGSMNEVIESGATGLHFEMGNASDLCEKAQWLLDKPDECRRMGDNARREYVARYTPEHNFAMLMRIYEEAIQDQRQSRL